MISCSRISSSSIRSRSSSRSSCEKMIFVLCLMQYYF
jgi:hypothetical protein